MLWQFSDELKQRKQDLISNGYDAYCLYALQGIELDISEELNSNYDYLIATPLTKMSHRSNRGKKYDVQEVLLGGYVFVYLDKNYEIYNIKSQKNYFRVLSRQNDNGKLFGEDLEYANWVLDKEGLITVSEAINMNGKVKIISGPLKSLEGHIIEYSKRNRNCKIEIDFLGQKINTWLPFEYVDIDMDDFRTNIK